MGVCHPVLLKLADTTSLLINNPVQYTYLRHTTRRDHTPPLHIPGLKITKTISPPLYSFVEPHRHFRKSYRGSIAPRRFVVPKPAKTTFLLLYNLARRPG